MDAHPPSRTPVTTTPVTTTQRMKKKKTQRKKKNATKVAEAATNRTAVTTTHRMKKMTHRRRRMKKKTQRKKNATEVAEDTILRLSSTMRLLLAVSVSCKGYPVALCEYLSSPYWPLEMRRGKGVWWLLHSLRPHNKEIDDVYTGKHPRWTTVFARPVTRILFPPSKFRCECPICTKGFESSSGEMCATRTRKILTDRARGAIRTMGGATSGTVHLPDRLSPRIIRLAHHHFVRNNDLFLVHRDLDHANATVVARRWARRPAPGSPWVLLDSIPAADRSGYSWQWRTTPAHIAEIELRISQEKEDQAWDAYVRARTATEDRQIHWQDRKRQERDVYSRMHGYVRLRDGRPPLTSTGLSYKDWDDLRKITRTRRGRRKKTT